MFADISVRSHISSLSAESSKGEGIDFEEKKENKVKILKNTFLILDIFKSLGWFFSIKMDPDPHLHLFSTELTLFPNENFRFSV